MTTQELKFEPEAVRALNIMQKTNKCIYLTGKAGAGKSTLVNYFISKTKKKYVLLGTTGVSAEMIGGVTIHRFFGLMPGGLTKITKELKDFIKEMDIFIIDEVSMMRADLFDRINKIMKMIMKNDNFMGGKQFIFVGDLFQLPPVPEKAYLDKEKKVINPQYEKYNEKYKGLFFFDGNTYSQENFEIVQLRKVYRQTDMEFVDMLNRIRSGDNSLEVINYFNKKYINKKDIHDKSILISTTNRIAYNYNREELDKLPGDPKMSKAFITGEYPEEIYPTDLWVVFKEGARVMFTVNSKEGSYMNGTLGTVRKIYGNTVRIEKDDGLNIEVGRNQWMNTDGVDMMGNPIILGTFTQYPFKLAFGITIHKCQGKSFDNVVVDLGWGAFAEGQVYVAFSRARNYEGLQLLKKLKPKDIKTSSEVINFLKK